MSSNKKKLKVIIIAFLLFLIFLLVLKIIPDRLPFKHKVIMWNNNTFMEENTMNTMIYKFFKNNKPPRITENLISLSNREDKTCISNITHYKIPGVKEDFIGDLIDGCDTKIIDLVLLENGNANGFYFWVMPLWNRTKNETHYLFDIFDHIGENKKRNRISVFVNESNYLVFRIIYKNGKSYESPLRVNFLDNYEWGFIAIIWNEKQLNLYFGTENSNILYDTKLPLKDDLYYEIYPMMYLGSDNDGKNQADSLFSDIVPITEGDFGKYFPYLYEYFSNY